MEYSIEQYEALKKAIASGSHSVSYGDKSVTYRSLEEMKSILSMIQDELFPERRPRRRRFASIDRGYYPS
ncbi:MAG: hypothetical protein LBH19_09680 [Dysgonamonadaceae bacterium]|nr:hypothetical protein [Dysgonamonadaceae bacterium]